MKYQTVLFDLDWTLTNTLPDLLNITNITLRESGYPERTEDEVRRFIGNGVKKLIERALPAGVSLTDEIMDRMSQNYLTYQNRYTRLYDGIPEMLDALHARGMKIGVVSNKPDAAVQGVIDFYLKGKVDAAVGQREGVRTKPAPDSVYLALDELKADPETCIYVGDSETDIETGQNAHLLTLSVTWGFRDVGTLKFYGAYHLMDTPQDIVKAVDLLEVY